MILDIFSESLSSHIKSESYNADNNSKDLITFCKCEGEKIYKNYFCKIHFLHLGVFFFTPPKKLTSTNNFL